MCLLADGWTRRSNEAGQPETDCGLSNSGCFLCRFCALFSACWFFVVWQFCYKSSNNYVRQTKPEALITRCNSGFRSQGRIGPLALLVQGYNALLFVHFELIHHPKCSKKQEHPGQCFTSEVAGFDPQIPGRFCPQIDSLVQSASLPRRGKLCCRAA